MLLTESQVHYLKNVMRKQAGAQIRFFNGRDGEWLAELVELKKREGSAILVEQIEAQPEADMAVHLIFAPLKKQRMDLLIEKAVELGVSDLHPVVTQRSDVRKINEARIEAQIFEAAEQCERFSIPKLHPMMDLYAKIQSWSAGAPLYVCLERGEDAHIVSSAFVSGGGFVIGPPGGFSPEEMEFLSSHDTVQPISLGKTVYRAETAAIICLVHAQYSNAKKR